jgi:hypothetical protein
VKMPPLFLVPQKPEPPRKTWEFYVGFALAVGIISSVVLGGIYIVVRVVRLAWGH